jgi:hypothetical protein
MLSTKYKPGEVVWITSNFDGPKKHYCTVLSEDQAIDWFTKHYRGLSRIVAKTRYEKMLLLKKTQDRLKPIVALLRHSDGEFFFRFEDKICPGKRKLPEWW